MKAFVGVTDKSWFRQLSASSPDEVNFWQPSAKGVFRALSEGDLFLFKLHSPDDFIVGGGVFAHYSRLPVSLAWRAFGRSNGAESLEEMRRRISRYRREKEPARLDYEIGCIVLTQPFFLPQERWLPAPPDWSKNIVRGKTYDLTVSPGFSLLEGIRAALSASPPSAGLHEIPAPSPGARFGRETTIRPRLGQGAFRVVVTDAYSRRCAITGERVLPVLEAAHIRPYSAHGTHELPNGILLRSDFHQLFDGGYVTIAPDYRLEVSRKIREEFENGREYYAYHGRGISVPGPEAQKPAPEHLRWHNENQFLG